MPLTEEYTLYSVPLPGSGSVLAFMLNMLRDWVGDGTPAGTGSNLYWHRIVETFKYAYAKRTGLGDPSRSNLPYDIRDVSNFTGFVSSLPPLPNIINAKLQKKSLFVFVRYLDSLQVLTAELILMKLCM